MKKILLSSLFFLIAFVANAQGIIQRSKSMISLTMWYGRKM